VNRFQLRGLAAKLGAFLLLVVVVTATIGFGVLVVQNHDVLNEHTTDVQRILRLEREIKLVERDSARTQAQRLRSVAQLNPFITWLGEAEAALCQQTGARCPPMPKS